MNTAEKVMVFAPAMVREMRANEHLKGGEGAWCKTRGRERNEHAKLLIADAAYHLAKLARAVYEEEPTRAVEHAADTANLVWMTLDALGYLTPEVVAARASEPDDMEHYPKEEAA